METKKHLRVLIVEDSINAAQELINLVRNLGHASRDARADDVETLLQALHADEFDVVFCAASLADLPIETVRATLDRLGIRIPLIAYGEDVSPEAQIDYFTAGATALVSKSMPEHLDLVLTRELERLEICRRLEAAESALLDSERRCQSLLDSSQDAIAYVLDGMHIYANRVYLELFGFKELADIEGTPIMDMVEEDDRDKLKSLLGRYSRGDKDAREIDVRGVSQGGARLSIGMELSDATYEEEECIQVVIRDYTATRRLESQVADLITRDQLTGLFNRHYFVDALEDVISGTHRKHAGIIYFELDGVASLKEHVGLSGTDVVLREVATVIAQLIGESGVVARLTDIAFTVLVLDGTHLAKLADTIIKTVAAHTIKVDGESLSVSISAGFAMLSVLPNEPEAAIDGVDQACADARAAGGNAARGYRIARETFDNGEDDQAARQLAKLVRDAITSRRLKLLFQPIASMRGESDERYEAQLRMLNEKGDEVHPRQFMAAAVRFQLAPSLDRWVVLAVLGRCAQRRKANKRTTFFVKLAPTTVTDAKFLPWLEGQLKKARLDAKGLVFEASESTVLDHMTETKAFIAGVKKLGGRFALNNFGMSSGAIKLLKHVHPEFVRVHGDMVRVIHEDDAALRRLHEIAKAVKALGATSIATHVDDAVLLPLLWQAGVDLMQGSFLQEPGEGLTFDFVGEMF